MDRLIKIIIHKNLINDTSKQKDSNNIGQTFPRLDWCLLEHSWNACASLHNVEGHVAGEQLIEKKSNVTCNIMYSFSSYSLFIWKKNGLTQFIFFFFLTNEKSFFFFLIWKWELEAMEIKESQ